MVHSVLDYLAIRQEGKYFLSHAEESPVTHFQFNAVFKRCLLAIEVQLLEFGTQCFCIGEATEASRTGKSNALVQCIGHWRSSCFAGYIHPELLN